MVVVKSSHNATELRALIDEITSKISDPDLQKQIRDAIARAYNLGLQAGEERTKEKLLDGFSRMLGTKL